MLSISSGKYKFSAGQSRRGSGDVNVFVQLEGEAPLGVVFDVVDDEGGDGGGSAPFGLEEEEAAGGG